MSEQKEKPARKIHSGTIADYVLWRGDIPFSASRWGEIDAVIAAMIAYANLGENTLTFESGQKLMIADLAATDILTRLPQDGIGNSAQIRNEFLRDLAQSARFRDIRVLDQVNDVSDERNIQFSATTLDVPEVGVVIAYRGTDPTPVGWKEDFMMSYVTPVPAQTAALDYLKRAAGYTSGPMILCGHSKGGNLALYAAAHTEETIQDRITSLYSFDGPGLDDNTIASQGYRRISSLIRSVVPSGSIVGMLMNYYPKYRIVQSNAHSIMQHDPFTWQLIGKRFIEKDNISNSAQIMDQTIHEWLKSCTPQQREVFITAIFAMLDRNKNGSAEILNRADDSAKQMIQSLIKKLISIHASISWEANIRRPLGVAVDEMRQRLKALQGTVLKSDVISIDNHGNGFNDAIAETMRFAAANGLDHKNCLRLSLFAEEMLSLASIITGDMQAVFWLESMNTQYELHMTTTAVMDKKRRRQLRASIAAGDFDTSASFLTRLKGAFEKAMLAGTDQICFDMPTGPDREKNGRWDGYERSVLVRLADNVRVILSGREARLIVRKDFSRPEGEA